MCTFRATASVQKNENVAVAKAVEERGRDLVLLKLGLGVRTERGSRIVLGSKVMHDTQGQP
jgi:hypothetical protein